MLTEHFISLIMFNQRYPQNVSIIFIMLSPTWIWIKTILNQCLHERSWWIYTKVLDLGFENICTPFCFNLSDFDNPSFAFYSFWDHTIYCPAPIYHSIYERSLNTRIDQFVYRIDVSISTCYTLCYVHMSMQNWLFLNEQNIIKKLQKVYINVHFGICLLSDAMGNSYMNSTCTKELCNVVHFAVFSFRWIIYIWTVHTRIFM